jgi:site-specific DNA recombinase
VIAQTRKSRRAEPAERKVVRCAIYTRKSTEEGLDSDFNSLDAQRESGEAYIASQRHEGWVCLPDRYDDGGFTGGNMDRPALRRLLADIETGRVDVVIVYKVDRLSRSLLDFSRIMDVFDRAGVSFVSVTQQFNTTHSMGRLTLNILLSFAQFEREIISERTRDKMSAARRKGKYIGGTPVLGYDIDREAGRLVIHEAEAEQVRQMFALYIQHQSLQAASAVIQRRGWTTKRWTTRQGKERGGSPIDKTRLHLLLTNVVYIGKVRHGDQLYVGEHRGIVDPGVFDRVQEMLSRNSVHGGASVRVPSDAILKGLLRCVTCDCAMVPTHTKKSDRRYRYYVCSHSQKNGRETCPSKSVPASQIEQFVVDRIRKVGSDPELIAATTAAATQQSEERRRELQREQQRLEDDLRACHHEMTRIAQGPSDPDRLVVIHERIDATRRRLAETQTESEAIAEAALRAGDVAEALHEFHGVWDSLTTKEQSRVLHLLLDRVDYDGAAETVSLVFRSG